MTRVYEIRIETRQTGSQTERDKYFETHKVEWKVSSKAD